MSSPSPTRYPDRVDHAADEWYVRARANAPHLASVQVDGADIRYRRWDAPDARRTPVVLVHGGAAHSGWWDHIGPLLAGDRTVVAPDLSGHGDSDRRDSYTIRTWADEIEAVASAVSDAPPVLVAHSMGGISSLFAASVDPGRIAGLILVDPLAHDVTSAETHARTARKFGVQRTHPSREVAVSRFKVMPVQRTLNYVFDHIAQNSVREVDGGWRWKHDPAIYGATAGQPWSPRAVTCPVAAVLPEYGLADREGGHIFGSTEVPVTQSVVIAGAGHHVMMDEPLALIACLRILFSAPPWSDGARG